MTILSALHSSRIRNRSMGVLHLIAADESCEVSDILALLPFPSQPTSTPAVKAHIDEPSSIPLAERPTSLPGTDGAEDRAPIAEPEAEVSGSRVASKAKTGKSVGEQSPAAPASPKISNRQRVRDYHAAHPDCSAGDIALATGISKTNIWAIASQLGIKFVGKKAAATKALQEAVAASPETRDEFDQRLMALHQAEPTLIRPELAERLGVKRGHVNAAVARLELSVPHARASNDLPFVPEVIPPANPQKPVGAAPAITATLTEKVAAMHRQHPTWTGRLIANALGANPDSVSAMLATARRRAAGEPVDAPPPPPASTLPNQPAGQIEANIRVETVARRKRLGAPA